RLLLEYLRNRTAAQKKTAGDVRDTDPNDSLWLDLGLPLLEQDGRQFRILAAPLVVDLDGRVNVNTHKPHVLSGDKDTVSSIAAAGFAYDRKVRVLDVSTGELLFVIQLDGKVFRVAFSPDGKLLAGGGEDKAVHLWDATTGKEVRRFVAHTDKVTGLAFSADG